MKAKITLALVLVLSISFSWSQVGIGTNNPQKELHVAGENSTIRVDGLNTTNNANNLGDVNLYNMMVNADGDLVLGKQSGVILSESGTLVTNIQTQSNSALNSGGFLNTQQFVLEQRALVIITYSVSMTYKSFDAMTAIDDGRAKVAHTYFNLGDGTTPDDTIAYGMTSNVYSNSTCEAADGLVYNTHTTTMFLNPGTYSVHLFGSVYGGGQAVAAAFSVDFGEQYAVDVSAIYL